MPAESPAEVASDATEEFDEIATFATDTSADALTALLSAVAQVVLTDSVPEFAAVASVAADTDLLSATAIAAAPEVALLDAVAAATLARLA